jgi:hypothetical protein
MTLANEAKTLARPFNLKRYTTNDGIHTLPISFLSDQTNNPDSPPTIVDADADDEEEDDDDDDDE